MHMDKVANSGNDEFFTPLYAVEPLLKYVNPAWKVWCPFDTEESLIVKALKAHGNSVTATHLSTGRDFFTTTPETCDCIISNPPYSKKSEVFARLFSLSTPFAMLVGVVGLFESKRRFELFKANQFEIMWMSKRVSYFKSYADKRPSLNPPFSSVWLTSKVLPSQFIFEHINK